ncbi:MAG: NADH-quinone oxidoreductase subunit NuoN [Gammaproteobacteria bacterium]|nr:NADH-quinone oxidoreductase subunit NuoN [Gammaproteobacteria bacterium]
MNAILPTLNFKIVSPELFILGMVCVVLLVDLFVSQRKRLLTYALTQLTLVGAAIIVICLYSEPNSVSFYGLFVHDKVASLLGIAIILSSIFVFMYSRDYINQRNIPQGEFYMLGLFSILGMLVVVSGHNFLSLYLGLELMSLPIYAMVALYRHSSRASEAAIKYFVLGALSSGMLLFGLSFLYGATGSLDISKVASVLSDTSHAQSIIFVLGLVFVVAGLAFKLGVVPFHMWIPDVYEGAPTAATLFLTVAPKIAAFGLVIRLLVDTMPSLHGQWQQLLILLSILSMVLGNVVAIAQTNIKRMLAYSTIAHGGYMLLGLCAATPEGYAASMFYTLMYAVMSLGGFGMVILLAKKDIDLESIDDLKGLSVRNPWLALMMLIILFSMAGIPPTAGFFAKVGVLEALVDAHLVWLACIAIILAVIGAYYYLRVVKVMYFDKPQNNEPLSLALDSRIAISLNGLALLALGIVPSAVIQLAYTAFVV